MRGEKSEFGRKSVRNWPFCGKVQQAKMDFFGLVVEFALGIVPCLEIWKSQKM